MSTSILDAAHPNLLFYYNMTDIDGSTLKDESGKYDGTINDALQVTDLIGNVLLFDSGGAYLTNTAPIDVVNGFVFSGWVKRSEPSFAQTQQTVLRLYHSALIQLQFGELQDEGRLHVRYNNGSVWSDICIDPAITPTDEWQHIIMQLNQDGVSVYRENQLVGSHGPITATPFNTINDIGSRSNSTIEGSVGSIAHVRVFNLSRNLTNDERTTLYEEAWPYQIKGVVRKNGVPIQTSIGIYDAATLKQIGLTTSDSSGAYQIKINSNAPLYVFASPPQNYLPILHGPINPVQK